MGTVTDRTMNLVYGSVAAEQRANLLVPLFTLYTNMIPFFQ